MDLLEQVQRGDDLDILSWLELLSYEDKLSDLGLFSLVEENTAGNYYYSLSAMNGACKREGEKLFTRPCSDWTRDDNFN